MGYKSRPAWHTDVCIGYCKFKGGNCPGQCIRKSKFVDCRNDCLNYGKLCDACENASMYCVKSLIVGLTREMNDAGCL